MGSPAKSWKIALWGLSVPAILFATFAARDLLAPPSDRPAPQRPADSLVALPSNEPAPQVGLPPTSPSSPEVVPPPIAPEAHRGQVVAPLAPVPDSPTPAASADYLSTEQLEVMRNGITNERELDTYLAQLEKRARARSEVTAAEVGPGYAAIRKLSREQNIDPTHRKYRDFSQKMIALDHVFNPDSDPDH